MKKPKQPKAQGKDRGVALAKLHHTLATEQKQQNLAAAQAKAGAV